MSEIIAIANQKGGVGKTTTAVNMSVALAAFGHRTLLVDLDPQSNSTSGLGIYGDQNLKTIYDVLCGAKSEEAVYPSYIENLDIIPTSHNLAGAEIEMAELPEREFMLKKAFSGLGGKYDFIIIDCPPSLGLLTVNALTAANAVISPLQCEFYSMEGLAYLMNTVDKVRAALNPSLKIDGGLITMFDGRTNLANQVKKELSKFYGDKLYKIFIPRNVRIAEAPSFGQPIFVYASSSKGAAAYREFVMEFLNRRGFRVRKTSFKLKVNKTEENTGAAEDNSPADNAENDIGEEK